MQITITVAESERKKIGSDLFLRRLVSLLTVGKDASKEESIPVPILKDENGDHPIHIYAILKPDPHTRGMVYRWDTETTVDLLKKIRDVGTVSLFDMMPKASSPRKADPQAPNWGPTWLRQ